MAMAQVAEQHVNTLRVELPEVKRHEADRESLLRSLEQSEARYRFAALATNDTIWDLDLETGRLNFHGKVGALQGDRPCLKDWENLIHPEDRERVIAGMDHATHRGQDHWQDEYRFQGGDGQWLNIVDRAYVAYNDEGRPARMVGAMQDVTARRRQEEFERQLVGIVSHDLRNPLNTITLAAAMMARSGDVGERAVMNMVRIQVAAERATRLIRDLLDFTRARLGEGIPIERRRVDLGTHFQELLEESRIAHANRAIKLHAFGNTTGDFDGDRLAQVLTNLIENAVKYGFAGSTVDVVLRGDPDGVLLTVHNDGPAIPADLMRRMFEPLQRGAEAVDVSGRSIGLGLYIVKHLVERHGGRIAIHSSDTDGTVVEIWLPRSVEEPQRRGT
jgi:signal transduction histidine kinase